MFDNFNPLAGFFSVPMAYQFILDQNYNILYPEAKFMDIQVQESSRTMQNPTENGTLVADHRIILPVKIDVTLSLTGENYYNVFSQMRDGFLNNFIYAIQTRGGVYEPMVLEDFPHLESKEPFDGMIIRATFISVNFQGAYTSTYNPDKAKDADTVDRGTQQGSTSTQSVTQKATSGLDNVK